jgi:hypothetical protein
MNKVAITSFGRGVMYNFILSMLVCVLTVIYLTTRKTKCEGFDCIGDGLAIVLLPLFVIPLFWFAYGFVMNNECAGSGYVVWMSALLYSLFYHYTNQLSLDRLSSSDANRVQKVGFITRMVSLIVILSLYKCYSYNV